LPAPDGAVLALATEPVTAAAASVPAAATPTTAPRRNGLRRSTGIAIPSI
jgi:hypothetical protein